MAVAYSRVIQIKYLEHEGYVEGVLPSGESFYFDTEDYSFVKSNYWHQVGIDKYMRSTKHGLMHRQFMKEQLSGSLQVDHINRNRLDNRRSNLRIVTHQGNQDNKSIYSSNKSGYRGVKWNKLLNKWQSQITRNKQRTHLGVFESFQEAVIARKIAERA